MDTSGTVLRNTEKVTGPTWLSKVPRRPVALAAILVFCTAVHLFLQCSVFSRFQSVSTTPQHPSPTTVVTPDLYELNWTTCPTEHELRIQQHYNMWDEKLAKQLRLSAQTTTKVEDESWQAVTDDIHVYSAFLVTTEEYAIHINSVVRKQALGNESSEFHPPLACLVRSPYGTNEYPARVKMLYLYYAPEFRPVFILCPPPDARSIASQNVQVAVTFRYVNNITLRWTELHIPSAQPKEKCCAICVRPFFGLISLWKLAEFIAHYRVLGVRSFYFYDLETSVEAKLLLGKMQAAGMDITLVRFKLLFEPADDSSLIHCRGQIQALHDCMFRSMSKVEYFIHVDLDELIVRPSDSKLLDMLQDQERKVGKESVGSIVLMFRLYCTEYPISTRFSLGTDVPLRVRSFTYHAEDLAGSGKYIARSRAISEAGVHFVHKHRDGASETHLDHSIAVLGHYRRCCDRNAEVLPLCHKPLENISSLYPSGEYLAAIENDLAIRTVKTLVANP